MDIARTLRLTEENTLRRSQALADARPAIRSVGAAGEAGEEYMVRCL
jgi:hypothetical protein